MDDANSVLPAQTVRSDHLHGASVHRYHYRVCVHKKKHGARGPAERSGDPVNGRPIGFSSDGRRGTGDGGKKAELGPTQIHRKFPFLHLHFLVSFGRQEADVSGAKWLMCLMLDAFVPSDSSASFACGTLQQNFLAENYDPKVADCPEWRRTHVAKWLITNSISSSGERQIAIFCHMDFFTQSIKLPCCTVEAGPGSGENQLHCIEPASQISQNQEICFVVQCNFFTPGRSDHPDP